MIQRLRVPLGFVAAFLVLYFASPTGVALSLGLPIALAGLIFRFLAAGIIRKDAKLATSGPYAWTRNPLYFGTFLLVVGFAIMSANVFLAIVLLLAMPSIYLHVIKKEEAHLYRLFPEEFPQYRAKVPAFFPRFRASEFHFSFAQYLANREYNAALGFVAMVSLFVAKWLDLFNRLI
jgi:protein-S-isoprenylcysteine O-methyltransferase Ste14